MAYNCKMTDLTLGSLFDGIGGFTLAGVHQGFTPVWASEIEPFPIEVTRLRFPDMSHMGDITKLKGAELAAVDVVCGGSPCQDLSVAGKRAGLQGERSGLFMEQVRVIKEMRAYDKANGRSADAVRPRYMCWENVPGASDSARYKVLGNSVAIPCVEHVLRGIAYFLRKYKNEQEESTCTSTPIT